MMDGNDVDNNNDDEIDHQPQEAEAEVAAAGARSSRRTQLMSLLVLYDACPLRTRNNIDELVAILLENAENDVHALSCAQNADDYRALDINRDTIKEVETIVRFFPNTLSKRKETRWGTNENGEQGLIAAGDGEGEYPIQCLMYAIGTNGYSFNFKATPFVAIVAQVAKELDQFEEEERGGLLIEDRYGMNTLQYLVLSSRLRYDDTLNQRVDIVCRTQFIQLQRTGLQARRYSTI